MASRPAAGLVLRDGDRVRLEAVAHATDSATGVALRAKIVLAAADGLANERIATRLSTSVVSVRKWRGRYEAEGMRGLGDAPRSGRPKEVDDIKVVALTLSQPPKSTGLETWSTREVAKRLGIGNKTVARIWKAWQIHPWCEEGFRFSTDPEFGAKVIDVVGLYLDPPENAVALCVEERGARDYVHRGNVTLLAALDIAASRFTAGPVRRHRQQEFLTFLRQVARTYPDAELHVVCDNDGAQKDPEVPAWLEANPSIHLHFTPTHTAWMNLVGVFFAIAERRAIRVGTFRSAAQLSERIQDFIAAHAVGTAPFVWTKSANRILVQNRKWKPINDARR